MMFWWVANHACSIEHLSLYNECESYQWLDCQVHLMSKIMNYTQESLFGNPCFPTLKLITQFVLKHKSFLDRFSLVSPPPLNNAFIIILMRLLKPHQQPGQHIRNRYFSPTINHTCMHTNTRHIVICCNFITRTWYEMGMLYDLILNILDLDVHEFNKEWTIIIRLVVGGNVKDP
jgi:hypothetical protein